MNRTISNRLGGLFTNHTVKYSLVSLKHGTFQFSMCKVPSDKLADSNMSFYFSLSIL